MKIVVKFLAVVSVLVSVTEPVDARAAGAADSVVKVFAQMRLPNPVRPWTKQNPVEVGGSGVVIEKNRILTNAHIVLYADEIFVQGGQGGDRVEAKIVAIGPAIDLAVLALEDDSFFAKRPPILRAAKLPEITSRVQVQGYPVGGTTLSTTQGTVARIEYEAYETGAHGLRIQVDAAINPGNSGGPALVDGKMIGLISGAAENIGFIIPNQEVDEFMSDVAEGRYDGKPYVLDQFQKLENESLRTKLGLAKNVRGIMVREPRLRDTAYPLREFDIVTKIGQHEVDNEGMIQADDNLHLAFTSQVPKLAKAGAVPISLMREGKMLEIALPVSCEPGGLIRGYDGGYPSYFVCGPLVFSPVFAEALPLYLRYNRGLAARNSPITNRHIVLFPASIAHIFPLPERRDRSLVDGLRNSMSGLVSSTGATSSGAVGVGERSFDSQPQERVAG
jgi:S1-C subfamily serine protease